MKVDVLFQVLLEPAKRHVKVFLKTLLSMEEFSREKFNELDL